MPTGSPAVKTQEPQTVPTVSVVMPTYNRAHLLPRAILSVLGQTFDDLELVIVDDGSTDNTAQVVGAFVDERIVYMRSELRRGVSAARNAGIGRARGKYVAFLDSDDQYFPHYLSVLVDTLASGPKGVSFAWSGIQQIEDRSDAEHIQGETTWQDHSEVPGQDARCYLLQKRPGIGYMVVDARCFTEVGLFDEQLQSAEDLDMLIRLGQHYDYRVVSEVLMAVHGHSGPQVSCPGLLRAEAYVRIANKHREFLREYPAVVVELYDQAALWSYQAGDKSLGRHAIFRSLGLSPFRWSSAWRILLYFELFGEPLPPLWREAAAGIRCFVRWWRERMP